MSNEILILTDYKGFFGSKQKNPVYRGGMDVALMIDYFSRNGWNARQVKFNRLDVPKACRENPVIIYTSSEDKNEFYKLYIEDLVYHLEQSGVTVIPGYGCLRAHNNKVALEFLRSRSGMDELQTISSYTFGTLEEVVEVAGTLKYPVVIKMAAGAMSHGVSKADNPEELIRVAGNFTKSCDLKHDIKEVLRTFKYRDRYVKESVHRKKIVVQNMIPGLENDWKVLVYGKRCYALYRGNRDNDFRASGSGKFIFRKDIPEGMLDFALKVRKHFQVPNISLDIGFDGEKFHLIEFQFLYFGTTTLEKSDFYFEYEDGKWQTRDGKSCLEEVYVQSITDFLKTTC